MTTTTTRAVGRALIPYVLHGLADHIIEYELAAPTHVDVTADRAVVYLREEDFGTWLDDVESLDPYGAKVELRADRPHGLAPFYVHSLPVRLPGSCVEVTLTCTYPAEDVCRGDGDTCQNVAGDARSREPGCLHGHRLCSAHRHECPECVDDMRQDRVAGSDHPWF